MSNIYVDSLHRALPRLLACFNMDETSRYAGVGDRYFWAWKLIDFPNGTFQAAIHGLAILLEQDLLPDYTNCDKMLERIKLLIHGLRNITHKNGSLDEALPYESSFCVTALVASDFLAAYIILSSRLSAYDKEQLLSSIAPMIDFLKKQDETHGIISNHLASASLALYRWHSITDDSSAEIRGRVFLDRILNRQSNEGWFEEYGGADPGYQSWCTTQLAQLDLLRPDLNILQPLSRSLEFLTYAAHPDGSFGGCYGSRNTRFLLPGGIEMLAPKDKNASALSLFARDSISNNSCVTLDCIDPGNIVPFFNDYALAAKAKKQLKNIENTNLPHETEQGVKWMPDSGLLIDSGKGYYSIVNVKKGGSAVHFQQDNLMLYSPAIVAQDKKNNLYSSYESNVDCLPEIDESTNEISVKYDLSKVERPQQSPFKFIVLRFLSLTLFRSVRTGNFLKLLLANYLIFRKSKPVARVTRKFCLGNNFYIDDREESGGLDLITAQRNFFPKHMASQGYWQRNDEVNYRCKQ